jgi:putative N6-adenine-specific DNA methylase
VRLTRENAARAGVAEALRIEQRALAEVEPPAPSGVLVANPPYGERLGDRRDLPRLYRAIGGLLRARFAGWTATVVVADARLASAFRLPVEASQPLTHGGLRVTLLRFGLSG